MQSDLPLSIDEETELTASDSPPSTATRRDSQPTFVGSVRISDSDISRQEMKWDVKIELRHKKWATEASETSKLMEKVGKKK